MKPLDQLDSREADRWIIDCRRQLASHSREAHTSKERADLRAAMAVTLANLERVAIYHPAKAGKITALIAGYAPEVAH